MDEGTWTPDQIADLKAAFEGCDFGAVADAEAMKAERVRENRIEALRAASRVVAGVATTTGPDMPAKVGGEAGIEKFTLALAEQFARWLEEGK